MVDPRGWLGDSSAFAKAAGSGAWDAGAGVAEGLGNLAKGGYQLATDPAAREAAWATTKQVAGAAVDYGEAVIDNPGKAFRDARDGALAAYDSFESARELAAAEGRSAEFFGNMVGGGAVEIGSVLIPAGMVAKAGKLGKVAGIAKTAEGVDNVGDVLSASQRAKAVSANPISKELDDKVSATQKCLEPKIVPKRLNEEKLPCFKKNKKGSTTEYDRQLEGQKDGLNNMTAQEYLDGRNAYKDTKRASTQEYRGEYKKRLIDAYETAGFSEVEAAIKAENTMRTLHALHNPDMIAGGKDAIADMGDGSVNQSIGAQWNKAPKGQTLSRVEQLDKAANEAIANGHGDANMNASLHRCK